MTVTINGTSGITTPGVNSTASNTLGDAVGDTLNVGNGTIVTDSSGNVGIGVSNPGNKVTLPNNAFIAFRNTSNSETGYIGMTSGNLMSYSDKFYTDSSGNLLVNQTSQSSSSKLAVSFSDATNQGIGVKNTGGSGGRFCQFLSSGGSEIGSIQQNGSSAVSYVTSSDYRLKENIQPMQNALGVVAQLNPVTYTWKADGSDGQGFIAHELQAVVPDCVTGEKDAVDAEGNPVYQGIDTSFLVATLAKAIQELSAKNDALEARLIAAEEQILALGVK